MPARFSLRARILGAFLLSFTLFLAALGYGLVQLQALGEGLTMINLGYVPLARVSTRLDASVPSIDLDVDRLSREDPRRLSGNRSILARYSSLIARTVGDGRATIAAAGPQVTDDDEERAKLLALDFQLKDIKEYGLRFEELADELLGLVEAGDIEAARALQPELLSTQKALRAEIDRFSTGVDKNIRRVSENTAAVQRRASLVSALFALAALVFGLAMLVLAVFALRPIGRLTRQVQRIAGGATGARVEVGRRDEVGLLAEEVNAMAEAIEQRDDALRARAAELDRARAELRLVLDSIRLGLVVVEQQRVSLANPAAERLWGVREGQALPPELSLSGERADALPIHRRLFDLRRVPFRNGFILVGEDVTELERQRERFARSERLALMGQMLAQITHEVRNPLNAMSLNVELLDEDLDELPEGRRVEAREILGTVAEEISRLEEVTEHYLTLARRPAPALEPAEPLEIARSVARLLDEELRRAEVKLTLSEAPLGLVDLDANQLRRALLNVVRNAVEAGARSVEVALARDEDAIRITVSDDGPGMSAEEAERAFDPFFSTKARGSGLGLAITRQILEDHAGSVHAAPVERGTRIVLSLPASDDNLSSA